MTDDKRRLYVANQQIKSGIKRVVIASLDGTTAWQVTQVRGTFAKES